MTFTFAPATREQAKARIALQGPGGSGKTKSALKIAEGFAKGGLIGVVDTERGSALKYAPVPGRPDIESHEFVHLPMVICSPENLLAAVDAAVQARVVVLIIDNWSHFWAGKGGLLARVDQESKKPGHYGGSYTAWAPVNDLEQDMLDALLTFPGHVICTMRTKNDYEMANGQVKKIGVKTVQRDGAEYEFDVVMDMVEGMGRVTKTRYPPLNGITVHHPGEDLAEAILELLGQGVDPVDVILEDLRADGLTYAGALELHAKAKARGLLAAPAAHPVTAEVMTLGAAIVAVGVALKPAPPAEPSPARQALDEYADGMAGAQSERPTAATPTPGTTAGPATDHAPESPAPEPGAIATSPQMKAIARQLNDLALPDDRDRRLAAVALLLGRPVLGSMNELSFDEATLLINELTGWKEREDGPRALHAHLDQLAGVVPAPSGAESPQPAPSAGQSDTVQAEHREQLDEHGADPATGDGNEFPPDAAAYVPGPNDAPAPANGIGELQMRKIFALLKVVGAPEERDRRLYAVSLLLGKRVGSMTELTSADGSELIDVLAAYESQGPEAFKALLNNLRAKAIAA
jgi:hypothetical protein